MTPRSLMFAALVLPSVASAAFGQGVQLNVLRVAPVGGGEGKSLKLEGFYYIGSPSFSKDGEWIAFDGYKGDPKKAPKNARVECWVVRSDGSEPRRVVRGATPRFSPDGKRLLFMREERKDLGRPGGEKIGVFVIDVDGTDERWIADGRWPDWSPDGKRIAYSVGGTSEGGSPRVMARICVADADGGKPEEVAIGDCPSWSPDGKKIACAYKDPAIGTSMVRIVYLGSGEQQFVGYGWFRPYWSADGKSLYANGVWPGVNVAGMVRLAADKRAEPEPILMKTVGQSPCPSPDGKSLVFCTIPPQPGDDGADREL